MVLACFSSGKISEKSVEISPRSCYDKACLYAHVQGLRIRTGRSIHEMRTSHIFDGKGLITAMRKRTTLLRAEQSRAGANCALFASCDCEALETEYNIRDG